MRPNYPLILLLGCMIVVCSSCFSNKKLAANYYYENEAALNDIEQSYRELYKYKPFSVEFTDRDLDYVSITFITEKLKYIYEFGFNEPRLADSIQRFQMDTATVLPLLRKMREIHCVWINNLDYYVDGQKKNMTFLSMKPILWKLPFTNKKYYILTFFNQPQYFDGEGRLLANRKQRRLRRINDDVFKRINDKVCYALSERFR
jgi:hypothetical protein